MIYPRHQKTLQGLSAFKRGERKEDSGAPEVRARRAPRDRVRRETGLEEYGGVLLLKERKAPLRLRVVCRPDVHMQLLCRLLRQIERLDTHAPHVYLVFTMRYHSGMAGGR